MKIIKLFFLLIISQVFVKCTKDYEILKNIEGISIVADSNVKQLGETTTLNLIDNTGASLTNEAKFYVNGALISGNTFIRNEEGSYVVTAKYTTLDAENTVTVRYTNGAFITFKPHVMVEDFTGTWCGNCPRVVFRLNQIEESLEVNPDYSKDQLIKVAIHRGNPTNPAAANYDPFNFDSDAYEESYFSGAYPKAAINRTIRWTAPQSNINMVIQQLQDIKRAGLALETNLTGTTLNVKVKSFFAENIPGAKLVVYVLENGLIHDQVNYSTLYPVPGSNPPVALSPLVNFKHDHTLRLCSSPDMLGDAISAVANTERLNDYNFTIPANYNSSNLEVVAFVTNANRTLVNARKIKIGEAPQSFQFN
jgi:hypothetical protein